MGRQTWKTRALDKLEAAEDHAARARCPLAVKLTSQLYALAREVGGQAGERINELGWTVDAEATAGREIDEGHVRQAFDLAERAIAEGG